MLRCLQMIQCVHYRLRANRYSRALQAMGRLTPDDLGFLFRVSSMSPTSKSSTDSHIALGCLVYKYICDSICLISHPNAYALESMHL